MEGLESSLRAVGGVARVAWLEGFGCDLAMRRRLLRSGDLVPVRHGWLSVPGADPEALAAVRAGGALSCVSALEGRGVWRPHRDGLHIRFDRAPRGPHPGAHVLPRRLGVRTEAGLDRPLVALAAAISCLADDDAVAVIDSAVRTRAVSPDAARRLGEELGGRARRLAARSSPAAASGAETHARLLLRRLRVRFAEQARIEGVGDVDFLIGDRLVLEVDGRAHHLGAAFFEDRRRDAALLGMGFLVLRTTYWEVLERPEELGRRILEIVRSRDHLWSSRTSRWRTAGLPDPVTRRAASESGWHQAFDAQ